MSSVVPDVPLLGAAERPKPTSAADDCEDDYDDERWNDESADFRLFGGGEFVDAETRRLLLSERFSGDDEDNDDEENEENEEEADKKQGQNNNNNNNKAKRRGKSSSLSSSSSSSRPSSKSRMPARANCCVIGDDALVIDLLLCRGDVTLSYVVAERSFDSHGEAADKAAIAALVERLYAKYAFEHRQSFADLVGEPPAPQAKPTCQFETSLDQVLMRPEINVVVVATPLKSRRFFVEAAIAAGKPLVLCKKPIVAANDAALDKLRADARAARVQLRELVEPRTRETQEKKAVLEELQVERSELRHETRDIVIAAAIGLIFSVFGLVGFVWIRARHARVALVVAVVCNITLIAVIVSVLARRAVVGGPMPHAPHSN